MAPRTLRPKTEADGMEVKIKESGDQLLVSLVGEFVGEASVQVQNAIRKTVDTGVRRFAVVWLDLSGVDFVDSVGLGTLMGVKVTCQRCKAKLILVGPSDELIATLVVVRFTKIFEIVSLREAQNRAPALFQP
jgi:anti-sigma B factor antagonist